MGSFFVGAMILVFTAWVVPELKGIKQELKRANDFRKGTGSQSTEQNAGSVLYQCKGCEAYMDVSIDSHIDESIYTECDCGELCAPVESPADTLVSGLNQANELKRQPNHDCAR